MLHVIVVLLTLLFTIPAFATVPESAGVDRYTGNGSTSYPYTFKIYSKEHLKVYVDNVERVLDVDYTVSGVSNDGGGVVIFFAPPSTNATITIIRNQPQEQFSVYTQNGFSPRQVEKDLDKLTMQVQQLQEQLTRALKFLPDSTASTTVDPPAEGYFVRAKTGGGFDFALPSTTVISTPVSIANGGTGAITAPAALTSLGATPDTGPKVIDGKGDLLAGSADDTWVRVPVGADGSVLTANSSQPSGVAWVATGAALFSTGDVKYTLKSTADSGWILLNDGTIGSGSSGATTRANADTEDLYTLIWNNCPDQWCPATGGRGANAAADFAANKPIGTPRVVGRTLSAWHPSSGAVTRAAGTNTGVDLTGDTLTVDSNTATWITGMPVMFTLTSGTVTGLTSGNIYYVIRNNATTVKLASTLANAQNNIPIDLTAKSSPVWSIQYNTTARAMGEYFGEEAHAMSSAELLAHTHNAVITGGASGGGAGSFFPSITSVTGGNSFMNQYQPTLALGLMMKL